MTTSAIDSRDEQFELSVVEREVLRALYPPPGKTKLYDLHMTYRLLPTELSKAIRRLESRNLISLQGDDALACITEHGRRWVLSHRIALLGGRYKQYWKEIPQEFLAPKWPKDKPFLPREYRENKQFYDALLAEGERF
jgi:hypothetical protein